MAQGHILDANTLALYRFDEASRDPRAIGPVDSTGYRWTFGTTGSSPPPLIAYSPAYAQFARRFSTAYTPTGQLERASAGVDDLNRCYGSWTVEAFVQVVGAVSQTILTFAGAADESTANNIIMSARVESTRNLSCLWEYAGAANENPIASATTLVANTWVHLAWVKDSVAKTVSFYVDGVLQGGASVAYANEATLGSNGKWVIGSSAPGGGGSTSSMYVRQVSFSTVVRDAAWIAANAARLNLGTLITDEDTYFVVDMSNPLAEDASGNGHHMISEPEALANSLCPPAPPLIDDGGNSRYLSDCLLSPFSHSPEILAALLAGPFTFEAWIFLLEWDRAEAWGLFCHGDPGVDSAQNNYWVIQVETDGSITVDIENGAGVNGALIQTPAGVVDFGVRTHVAVRASVAAGVLTIDIFVNGALVHSGTGTPFDSATSAGNSPYHQIGRGNLGTTNRFTGYIDDVRLSDVARTDAEILESYERGVAAIDDEPPTITIISPTPGVAPGQPGGFPRRRSDAVKTPVVLRVGDVAPGLAYVGITVRFYGSQAELDGDDGGVEEAVYRRGAFRGKHVRGSSVEVDGTDLVFTIMRDGGWVGRYLKFSIDPIDGAGNLA